MSFACMLLIASYVHAQDTMSINGTLYRFVGKSDTVSNNGSNYIVKYIVIPEMADQMRADGKIYVVVVVLATIFAGIFTYLIYLDRKITRLEKENKI